MTRPLADHRQYAPLPMPTGKFNARQKAIWKSITQEIRPGHIAKGNEIHLLVRLVKAHWRAEYLEAELEGILEKSQTALVLGGNGQATVNPIFTQLERAASTVASLSQKLRLAPVSRIETKAAAVNPESVENPTKLRDPEDLLFGDSAPATKAEEARWRREGKLQ